MNFCTLCGYSKSKVRRVHLNQNIYGRFVMTTKFADPSHDHEKGKSERELERTLRNRHFGHQACKHKLHSSEADCHCGLDCEHCFTQ